MTPALKAMVEAMALELSRQPDARYVGPPPMGGRPFVNGPIDLERVARAGLEALLPRTPATYGRAELASPLDQEAIRQAVNAILGEKS